MRLAQEDAAKVNSGPPPRLTVLAPAAACAGSKTVHVRYSLVSSDVHSRLLLEVEWIPLWESSSRGECPDLVEPEIRNVPP